MSVSDKEKVEMFKSYRGKITTNSFGMMLEFDDPIMIKGLKLIDKSRPVLDIGVAYGYSTRKILSEGFSVIANDLSEEMLKSLWEAVSENERGRLTLKQGNVLDLSFEENSLNAIVALNVIHFLKGDNIRNLFEKFNKWLAPGGVLVVSCVNPMVESEFEIPIEKEYKENVENGKEWPGEFNLASRKSRNVILRNVPDFCNFLTLEVLTREAIAAGFQLFEASLKGRKPKEEFFTEFGPDRLNFSSLIAVKDMFCLEMFKNKSDS